MAQALYRGLLTPAQAVRASAEELAAAEEAALHWLTRGGARSDKPHVNGGGGQQEYDAVIDVDAVMDVDA